MLFLISPALVLAQTDKQAWVQRYGNAVGSDDRAYKVISDSAGNIIVAGSTDEKNTGSDILVIKYSNAGVPVWINRYNGPANGNDQAKDVAVDSSGNVFVTGNSDAGGGANADFATIAYSSAGALLWTNRYGRPGNGNDFPVAMTVDGDGNVLVTGTSIGSGGYSDYTTIAYSGTGVPMWTNYYNGPGNNADDAVAIGVDGSGNVFVTGSSTDDETHFNYATIKYSGAGVGLWTNRYNGVGSSGAKAYAVAVDGSGDAFVTGYSAGFISGYQTIKYSGSGIPLWTNRYAGPGGGDIATTIVVDTSGKVFVTGYSFGNGTSFDYATVAYTGAGLGIWTNRYNGPGNSSDIANAMAVDGSGNVFVTGVSSSGSSNNVDYATIAYSNSGAPLWTNRYQGAAADGSYKVPAVAIDGNGNVFVAGYSFSISNSYDQLTIAYSIAGVTLWTNRYNGRANGNDRATAAAVDGSGNVFVTGNSANSLFSGSAPDYATVKFSSAGTPLWTNRYNNGFAGAVAVDGSGDVFVTGTSTANGGNYDYATIKYSGEGAPLWTNRYSGPGNNIDQANAVAVDNSGNVFVTGYSTGTNTSDDYATIGYSNAGAALWTNRYNGPGNSYDIAAAVAVDSSGNVFVTGYSTGNGGNFDYATIKYSGVGEALWTNRYNGPGNSNDFANSIAIDSSGNVFVTGYSIGSGSNYDYATIAYSGAGVALWTNRYDGPGNGNDQANAIAVDGSGNVSVTGFSAGTDVPLYDNGYATIKYSGMGVGLWTNRFRGSGTQDYATGVAVDSVGNVFVTGYSDHDGDFDYATIAYASEGAALWTNRYDGPANGNDADGILAVSGIGNVIVVGTSDSDYSPNGYAGDYGTVKYVSGFTLVIASQPTSRENDEGTTAAFSVTATGTAPFGYQWKKNATNIVNGGSISGATTANLTLSSVTTNDAANYTVVVSNPAGSATSEVAVLRVVAFGAPIVLLNGNVYSDAVVTTNGAAFQVQLTTAFAGGSILYTTNGSDPFGGEFYSGPFQIAPPFSIRAVAFSSDFLIAAEAFPVKSLVASSPGGGSISSNVQLDPTTRLPIVALTSIATPGWTFMNWAGDASGSNSTTFVTLDQPKSVQAIFGTRLNNIVSGSGAILTSPQGPLFPFGSTARLNARPETGYYFRFWLGAVSATNNPLDIVVTNALPTMRSIFALLPTNTFALTLSISGDGSVSRSPQADYYTNGTTVTLTATPGGGQSFTSWGGDAAGSQNPLMVTMTSNKLVIATFGTNALSFSPPVLPILTNSVLARVNPNPPSPNNGSISILTYPVESVGQWRLEPELVWHNSGGVITGLVAGNHSVRFNQSSGYIPPADTLVQISAGETSYYAFSYSAVGGSPSYGSLQVNITPPEVATNINALLKGRWRVRGETNWHNSGDVVANVLAGTNNIIEFSQALSYVTPPPRQVIVGASQINVYSGGYANYAISGQSPTLQSFADATNTALDFGFNGQLLSEAGFGSGCVVKPRVVLSAGHVVFNDQTLSYVNQMRWFFQRHSGIYEPAPQTPRGWYVLDGYAAARTNDNSPGVSSLASENLDVAAIFFTEDAGRGGYSGYLVSEAPPTGTEWLQQPTAPGASKVLMGYPVEASNQQLISGRLYATPSSELNINFGLETNRVFSTGDIHGYPGMSGGPLCVPFTNEVYYPAAVYLGGSGQATVVRAIDSAVGNLISQAEKTAYTSDNHTGGGVLLVSVNFAAGTFAPGYIQIRLGPPAAVSAGGAWRVLARNINYNADPNLRIPLAGGTFEIEFAGVPGWSPPTNQPTIISPDQVILLDENYFETGPSLDYRRTNGLTLFGSSGLNYRIDVATSLAPTNWTLLTNLTLTNSSQVIGGTLPTKLGNRFFRAVRP